MRECNDGSIGVMKDKNLHIMYRECLEFVLARKTLTVDVNVSTLHPTSQPMKEVDRLCEMIRSYHRDEKTNIITSKVDGRPDDILAALNQLLFWGAIFWQKGFYMELQRDILRTTQYGYAFPTAGSFEMTRKRKRY